MQYLLAALGYVIAWVGSSLIKQIFVALGIGAVTYLGISEALEWGNDYLIANLAALPANLLVIIKLLNVGKAIGLLLSAWSVRATLVGLAGGLRSFSLGRWSA